jgi:hypothetical protein
VRREGARREKRLKTMTKAGTAVLRTYDGTSLRFVTTAASPMTILAVIAVLAVLVGWLDSWIAG